MKVIVLFIACLLLSTANAKDFKTISEEVDNAIDQTCDLHQDADRVLLNLGNNLIDRVNSRVSSILDAFQMDCLADLLRLGDLGIPGFGNAPNLDFCQIVRSRVLSSGFSGYGGRSMDKSEMNEVKRKIELRHQEREDLFKQLEGDDNG